MSEEREQCKAAIEQLKAWAALSGAPGETLAGKLRELFVAITSYVESIEAERDELRKEVAMAWCAWHPDQGFAVFTVSEHRHACLCLLADSYGKPWGDDEELDAFMQGEGAGWQVVRVSIRREDESDE